MPTNLYVAHYICVCSVNFYLKRNSRGDTDWKPNLKAAGPSGSARSRSNYNLKFRTSTYMVLESDSETEFIRTVEDLEEESSRSTPNERAGTSPSVSLSESLPPGKRPRGRPRKDSGGSLKTSPAAATLKQKPIKPIRSTQSSPVRGHGRRGRPPRTVPQSALAAKRITRLAAGQNHLPTQKTTLGSTRIPKTEKQEPADQMLLSLGLKKVAPASSKPSGSQLSLPLPQLRALAFDMFFASVPDFSSVTLVHSLLPPGVDQFAPEQV